MRKKKLIANWNLKCYAILIADADAWCKCLSWTEVDAVWTCRRRYLMRNIACCGRRLDLRRWNVAWCGRMSPNADDAKSDRGNRNRVVESKLKQQQKSRQTTTIVRHLESQIYCDLDTIWIYGFANHRTDVPESSTITSHRTDASWINKRHLKLQTDVGITPNFDQSDQ